MIFLGDMSGSQNLTIPIIGENVARKRAGLRFMNLFEQRHAACLGKDIFARLGCEP